MTKYVLFFLLSALASAIPVPGLASLTPKTKWAPWQLYPHVTERMRLDACAQGLANYAVLDAYPRTPAEYAIVVGDWQLWHLEEHVYWIEDEGKQNGKFTYVVEGDRPLTVATNAWHGDPSRGDSLSVRYRTEAGTNHTAAVRHVPGIPATLSFAKCTPYKACDVKFWMEIEEPRYRHSKRVDNQGNYFPLKILSSQARRSTAVFDYEWRETSNVRPHAGGILELIYDPRRSADTLFRPRDLLHDWSTFAVVRFHLSDGSVRRMRTRIVSAERKYDTVRDFHVLNRAVVFPVPENASRAQLWFETIRNVQRDTRVVQNYDSDFSRDFWFEIQ